MIVQGLWEFKSPLLQLPYINDDNLKYFMTKKKPIKSLQQYAQLKGEDRRNLLRSFSDEEYENVMKVLGNMPYVDFQVKYEGKSCFLKVGHSLKISFILGSYYI